MFLWFSILKLLYYIKGGGRNFRILTWYIMVRIFFILEIIDVLFDILNFGIFVKIRMLKTLCFWILDDNFG